MGGVTKIDGTAFAPVVPTVGTEGVVLTNSKFGGGNGSGPVDPVVPVKDYIDARDDAVESRLAARMDKLATSDNVRNNIWGAAAVILGTLLTVLAFGGDRFDGGVSASSLLNDQAKTQAQTDQDQDTKLQLMDQKLDILIKQTAGK